MQNHNIMNKLSYWIIEQRNYLSGPVMYDQIYNFLIANRVDPDQADVYKSVKNVSLS